MINKYVGLSHLVYLLVCLSIFINWAELISAILIHPRYSRMALYVEFILPQYKNVLGCTIGEVVVFNA